MEQSRYLLLWLEGPLQAWGHDSKFGVRDTLNFPTRSGVLGLLCCARGAGGPEQQWLAQFADLSMEVHAFAPQDKAGQAQLNPPPLCDFHMVGSGYDDTDPWQSLLIPKTSVGKKATGGGTKMTYRYYLQDAAFAVILQIPTEQEESLSCALQQPVWDLYLGRKNCVPTELIFQGVYQTPEQAWQHAQELSSQKHRTHTLSALDRKPTEQEEDRIINELTLNDVPVQFGQHKRYRDRQVIILEAEESNNI